MDNRNAELLRLLTERKRAGEYDEGNDQADEGVEIVFEGP